MAWLAQIANSLVAMSSYNDDRERQWLKEVEKATYLELADPGHHRFKTMDEQLSIKVPLIMSKEVKILYDEKMSDGWKFTPPRGVAGRQCVRG